MTLEILCVSPGDGLFRKLPGVFCKLPLLSTADLGAGMRKGQQLNVDHMNYLQVWY